VKLGADKSPPPDIWVKAGSPDALFRGYLYLCAHLVASSLRHELLDPLQILDAQIAAKWHARGVAVAALFSLPVAIFTLTFVRLKLSLFGLVLLCSDFGRGAFTL
jgi:hypothetical protein